MYVYLITNNINQKKYVGITNNYKKRWSNEKTYPLDPKRRQAIHEAIHKYGKENFTFELLHSGLSIEEAVDKEYELIGKYHTWIKDPLCNGYNVDRGGTLHPCGYSPQLGEKNGNAKITDDEAQYILDHHNIPEYVLFEEFNDKITYDEFKQIYLNKKFTHLHTDVEIYPFNFEFSCQFNGSKLDYGEIVELREAYANKEYWRNWYEKYKDMYPNEWDFWNIYNGNRYKLVMPEVFTEELKHYHSAIAHSGTNNGRAKLNENDVRTIRNLYKNGATLAELYKAYPQVSTTSIRNIISYKTWKNIL